MSTTACLPHGTFTPPPAPGRSPSVPPRLNASIVGDGPVTLVLGNGLGTQQATWRHVVQALEGEARIVRFDYEGTPATDVASYRFDAYHTLHGHADDVVGLLRALDVRDAVFVGHSVSAMIGVLAATAVPERLTRLVLLAGSPRYLDDDGYVGGFTREAIDGVLAAAATDFQAWVAGFAPVVLGADGTPEGIEEFASYLRRMRPDIGLQTLRAIFLSDLRHLLPATRQPAHVLQPREDVAVPEAVGRYLASRLPHATLALLPSRGHLPHLTTPDVVVPELRRILAVHSRETARRHAPR